MELDCSQYADMLKKPRNFYHATMLELQYIFLIFIIFWNTYRPIFYFLALIVTGTKIFFRVAHVDTPENF